MDFYEVFLELISGERRIGKTALQLRANSRFSAAMLAEKIINGRYGSNIYSHTVRVSSIPEEEFLYLQSA
jgi:hypothetical protein